MEKSLFFITDRLRTGDTAKEIVPFAPLEFQMLTWLEIVCTYYDLNTEPFHTARFFFPFFKKKLSFTVENTGREMNGRF
jgi:hypothetical protein